MSIRPDRLGFRGWRDATGQEGAPHSPTEPGRPPSWYAASTRGLVAAAALPGLLLLALAISLDGGRTGGVHLGAGQGLAALACAALLACLLLADRRLRRAAHAAARVAREQVQTIAQLQQRARSRDTILLALTDGICLFEPNGRLAYSNRAAQAMVGRSFETASDVLPQGLRDTILLVRGRAGGPEDLEPMVHRFDTVSAAIEATVLSVEPDGAALVLMKDVTRSQGVERLRRDFVANASHELKTPVASILALSEALRSAASDDPPALPRFLAQLEQQAGRLASLVADLLELSRLEVSKSRSTTVRLDRLIQVEAERARGRAQDAGLGLQIEVAADLLISGSEPDLIQLVRNLLDNAVRYTPEGGSVQVRASASDGQAVLTVEDNGIGIPSRDLKRIFERFYRVDAARSRQTGGTGLGLSIVRHVAEAHGGMVEVRSVLGSGSTFTVHLPLRAPVSNSDPPPRPYP